MSKAEEFIESYTRNCSNEIDQLGADIAAFSEYHPWLTPDHARCVAEIAREETIKEVCEYIKSHRENVKTEDNGIIGWIGDDFIEDLKKYMED